MPIRLCLEPRCPDQAVYRGRCASHSRSRERQTHPHKHIYGTKRWQMLRRHKLYLNPICERCDRELATDVHHRVDLSDGGDPWAVEGLEALCHSCHSQISRRRQMA